MFCPQCGTHVADSEHFCTNCGNATTAAVMQQVGKSQEGELRTGGGRSRGGVKSQDPYKEQIQQLRMHIRQLKLDLSQINNNMGATRSHYRQTAAFLPWRIREGSKLFEDIKLLGKQPHKEQLQQQIATLQQELLGLEHAQLEWKRQQG